VTEEYHAQLKKLLTQELTEPQYNAATCEQGIILVRACAGAGKTRVITARVCNLLLNNNVPAPSVLALTFTNKAAQEMKQRIAQSLPPEWPIPFVGTFHSFCLNFLKRHTNTPFSLMDTADREQCIKAIMKRNAVPKRITPQQISSAISRHKNDITSVKQLSRPLEGEALLQQIYVAYEQEKRTAHCLDFDDLLLEMLKLFENNPDIKKNFQSTVRHILVDEYQDTNRIQHALIQAMSFSNQHTFSLDSLCVVGDEDQSIYGWRGATIANILSFPQQFPTVKTITLDQNYRSVQPILKLADHIIQQNKQRVAKTIWSNRTAHNRVRIISCASSFQEGDIVVACARSLQQQNSLAKLAILYRSHFQSRSLEESLIRHSIPYKIIGGTQFYDRQEVKDILAYVRVIVNPFDRISLQRCINTPTRSLGDAFVEKFIDIWSEQPDSSCYDIAAHMLNNIALPSGKQVALKRFIDIIDPKYQQQSMNICLEHILNATQFFTYLEQIYEPAEAKERAANIHELCNAVSAREAQGIISPAQFLEEITLLQDQLSSKEDSTDYVRLMTLHSAKGLEFDTVIIPGVEEGILPSTHAWSDEGVEEERRLLYVGITRARERLIITHSAMRHMYGRVNSQLASRFIENIPDALAPLTDIAGWYSHRITTDITNWFELTPCHQKKSSPEIPPLTFNNTIGASQQKISATITWRVAQRVKHTQFGIGTIVFIEASSTTPRLTIKFPHGIKKISASFVQPA